MKSIKFYFGIFFLLVCSVFFQTCKHDQGELITVIPKDTTHYPPLNENKIDSICYNEIIEPIISSGCAKNGCHNHANKAKGIDLSSYENLQATLSGPLLIQSINDNGSLGMPPDPNPKLTEDQIKLIQQWVSEGMKKNVDCEGPCDTSSVTFSNQIKSIIQNSCIACHQKTSPKLDSYDSVLVQVNNGKFLCTVLHETTCNPMPQNSPKLSNCKISQIRKWINNGAPNN